LNCNNKYIVENLVNSIEELELFLEFNLELKNLPNSIRKIIFYNDFYNCDLNSLADSIEYIRLPRFYNKKILTIPKSLKTIKCYKDYKFLNDYPKHIHIEIFLE
jgi:hypothetical protein